MGPKLSVSVRVEALWSLFGAFMNGLSERRPASSMQADRAGMTPVSATRNRTLLQPMDELSQSQTHCKRYPRRKTQGALRGTNHRGTLRKLVPPGGHARGLVVLCSGHILLRPSNQFCCSLGIAGECYPSAYLFSDWGPSDGRSHQFTEPAQGSRPRRPRCKGGFEPCAFRPLVTRTPIGEKHRVETRAQP